MLCRTLQAELKFVIWSDTYVGLSFIHFTSGFHSTKGCPDKTALMDYKIVLKIKKKKKWLNYKDGLKNKHSFL